MDSKWVELSESYPNLFPADTVSTDMPRVFAEAVDTLRNMTYEPEFSEQYNMPVQDVIYQVYKPESRYDTGSIKCWGQKISAPNIL